MNPDTTRDAVRRTLHTIAPEADLDALPGDANLRESLDLDSMDFLRFVRGLHDALGVEIAEADYPKLTTFDACVTWLSARRDARDRG